MKNLNNEITNQQIEDTVNALYAKYGKNAQLSDASATIGSVGKSATLAGGAIGASILNSKMQQNVSGKLSQNIGNMTPTVEPRLILKKKQRYYPPDEDIAKTNGMPSNTYLTLKKCKGFTRVKDVHVEIANATVEEKEMIKRQLMEGVIL